MLVHTFYKQGYQNPWLQKEWALCMLRDGRGKEAVKHFGVSWGGVEGEWLLFEWCGWWWILSINLFWIGLWVC